MNIIKSHHILFVLFLLVFFSVKSFPQTAFPLNNGNEWYYTITYHFHFPPIPPSSYKFSISGDTLMPNGKQYWIIEPRDMFWEKYIRSDSQYVYYYSWQDDSPDSSGYTDKNIFDIYAPPQTTVGINWAGYRVITAAGSHLSNLFNKPTTIYDFTLGGLRFGDISLSNDFGYVNYNDRGDGDGQKIWELNGCIISDTLYGVMTDINFEEKSPEDFVVFQNYPNPFNPVTKIEFIIPSTDVITLTIYNSLGQLVETLIQKELSAGKYSIFWNASGYSSGIYYYKIESSYFVKTKKCLLLK
jgi:hypothetical protein